MSMSNRNLNEMHPDTNPVPATPKRLDMRTEKRRQMKSHHHPPLQSIQFNQYLYSMACKNNSLNPQ